jgi:hypothetical protein
MRFDGEDSARIYANDFCGNHLHDFGGEAVAFEDREEVGLGQRGVRPSSR